MRISDWSSDVCSSDLPDLGDIAALNHLHALRLRIEVEREVIVAAAIVAVLEMARVDLVVAHAETAEFDRRTVSPAYQCDRPGLRQIFEAVAADRDRKSTRLNSSH